MLYLEPARLVPSRPVSQEIERRGLLAWLEASAETPVRILCAPIGSGKTVVARQLAARDRVRTRYVHVPAGAGADALRALVDAAGDPRDVVLDELDRAEPGACRALLDDVAHGGLERRLILVGRSRRRLQAHALVARGLARVCDPAAFAFDGEELGRLAAASGIAHEPHDVAQLLYDTEGWPLAAHWMVRDALEAGRSLRDAFAPWRERNAHLLFEFLQQERYEDADAYEAFRRILHDGWADAQHELERLEQLGLPLVRARGVLRPYRLLARLVAPGASAVPEHATTASTPPMLLNVLGRFRCEIAGRPVTFARRRDQQVFVYVAIAADGRTSRERLLEAFWPGVERTVASQGLRTTLSRIRRSILEAAPNGDPDRYFRTAGDVAIDTRTVAIDVRRFVDHVEQGRLDDARGNLDGAKHHYRVAQRVYQDRLLASDGPEPCLHGRAAELEACYVEVLTRLTSLFAATGDLEPARDYARALLARNTEDARRRAFSGFTGFAEPVPAATA